MMMGQRPGEIPAQGFLLSCLSEAMNRDNSLTVISDKILRVLSTEGGLLGFSVQKFYWGLGHKNMVSCPDG